MKLESISLSGFRNIESETVDFSGGVNALIGENAQGKTNLLEAIYLLACGKSFRVPHYREMIRHEGTSAKISAEISGGGLPFELKMILDGKTGKSIFKNGIRIEKLSEFLGLFRVVLFCPEHLLLIKGAPRLRRSFLDGAICQLRPYYASLLNEFLKTENQRSALLKQSNFKPVPVPLLETWEERLAAVSGKIAFLRGEYIRQLQEESPQQYERIAGGAEKFALEYKSDVYSPGKTGAEMAADYLALLAANRAQDQKYGFSQKGIHRDDFEISINSYSSRSFSSQGQQRSAVLSLKMAEGEISRRQTGDDPLYLFDDVLSELDSERRGNILSGLSGRQVIITGTDEGDFTFAQNRIFVEGGRYSGEKNLS